MSISRNEKGVIIFGISLETSHCERRLNNHDLEGWLRLAICHIETKLEAYR